jgi:hypothetical protein
MWKIPAIFQSAAEQLLVVPQVAKQSKAAQSMCLWVRAMDTYAKVSRVVEPKRQALGEAQAALDTMNAQLAEKQQQLEDIVQKVGGADATLLRWWLQRGHLVHSA